MKKNFSLEDETPLGYFTQITEFIFDPNYARYLRRIAAQYEREMLPPELDLMPFFVDQLIFNTYIKGKTPLEHFIDTFQSEMTAEQLAVYKGFKHYLFDCYVVLAHQPPDRVVLQDVLDHRELTLRDSDAKRFLLPGFYSVVRLLPFDGHYIPTGACAVLNLKTVPEAVEVARLLKVPPLRID